MTETTRVDRPQEARPPSGSMLFVVCIKGNIHRDRTVLNNDRIPGPFFILDFQM
jgi:hypothetical protein